MHAYCFCISPRNNDWPTSVGGKGADTAMVGAWLEDAMNAMDLKLKLLSFKISVFEKPLGIRFTLLAPISGLPAIHFFCSSLRSPLQ